MRGLSRGGALVWAILVTGALLLVPADVRAQPATPAADSSHGQPAHDTTAGSASSDTVPHVTFHGFIDTYYAYDVDRPPNFERVYTTQPVRWDEFNVNLAFVEAKLDGPRYRGRLALQYGTSVQENYANEPRLGLVSGPSVSQFIQEASVGYQLAKPLWIDAGIFLAHTGLESWISRDNLTYTRSMVADGSPYYEAGVRLTWAPISSVVAQVLVLNGWQNISNYNAPKAFGARVDYTASPVLTLSYDNFIGNMAADSIPPHDRFYNDFIVQLHPSARWQWAAAFAIGLQTRSASAGGTADWYGWCVIGKYHVSPIVAVVGRVEQYADPSQVLITTNVPAAFKTSGGSLGVDVTPALRRLLWRTEVRGFVSADAVWPEHRAGAYSRTDAYAVTSLALTL